MSETLKPIPVFKGQTFKPFAELDHLDIPPISELILDGRTPIAKSPLDFSEFEGLENVKGSIVLSAISQKAQDNMHLYFEPFGFGSTRSDKKQDQALLTVGTEFTVSSVAEFEQIFPYWVETLYQPTPKINPYAQLSYLHLAGLTRSVGKVSEALNELTGELSFSNFYCYRNTGGNIPVAGHPYLLPQDLPKIKDIQQKVGKPPFMFRTFEEILKDNSPTQLPWWSRLARRFELL